ncbi:MAG: hypothetical protein ACRBBR_11700 [Cellvibrionaceae bacterium]
MRIVSSCQGNSLKIFLRLLDLLETKHAIEQIGVYVSDSMSYGAMSDVRLAADNVSILTEWDVFEQAKTILPDWEKIRRYEDEIGDPVFWNVLLSDRRVFFGRKCKMTQDYPSRFSYEQMGSILDALLDNVSQFFEKTAPDLVISFGTSNVGDYLFYLYAKSKNIPFLQLKATKISNRVSLNDDIVELSSHINTLYQGDVTFDESVTSETKKYIHQVKKAGVQYEGAILQKKKMDFIKILTSIAKGIYADIRRLRNPVYRADNHLEIYSLLQLHEKVINPLRFKYQSLMLKNKVLAYEELDIIGDFVFYPLHFEPEVSMQVVGRPYQNQIELIRNISLSLPAGMKIVIKEHPRSKGFRSLGYYEKLLNIPNVYLADYRISTDLIVKKSSLVAVISGSTGLEAAIIGRPVITFGKPVYNVLSDNMVKHIVDLNQLSQNIKDLLNNYEYDIDDIERYIASTITGSAPVNLYTALLKKENRYSESAEEGKNKEDNEYKALADYFASRIKDVIVDCNV